LGLASIIIVLIFLSVILTAKPTANYNDAPEENHFSSTGANKATNLPTTK
jgi:hypothetical protein